MNTRSLQRMGKKVLRVGKKALPGILIGTGFAATWASGFQAGLAKPKADELIEKKKKEKGVEKLTPLETVQTVGKVYGPAAATGLAGAALGGLGVGIGYSRTAALGTMLDKTLKENGILKDEMDKKLTPEEKAEVDEKVAKTKLDDAEKPSRKFDSKCPAGGNWVKGYEVYTGLWFWCKGELEVREAQLEYNDWLIDVDEDGLSVRDWIDVLSRHVQFDHDPDELKLSPLINDHGWNRHRSKLKVKINSQMESGVPVLIVDYDKAPYWDYNKVFR